MKPSPLHAKRHFEELMQLTIGQQMNRPANNPVAAVTLAQALKQYPKTAFSLATNEGDLFRTCYYEDIEPLGLSIERRIDNEEISRCIEPPIGVRGGSLEEYTQYCIREHTAHGSECLLDQNKELEYYFKSLSRAELASDLRVWLPFFCEVCQRYDTWDHPAHLNKQGKPIRKPVQLSKYSLPSQLQLLKLESELPCSDEPNCALHLRGRMIQCAYSGDVDDQLIEAQHAARGLLKQVKEELDNIKCVIDHEMSYCMLRVLLWGSCEEEPSKPSCLALYFCVRKILGESPLDLQILERSPIEVELQIIQPTEDIMILDGPPKAAKYVMSKSNVCDGAGVFTTAPLKRGTIIGSYLGEILNTFDQSVPLRSRYQELANQSSYSFQSKNNVDIDALFYGNFTRMLNHMPCALANCRFVKNDADVVVVTVKDIPPGEELFVDYGTSYTEPWKEEFDRIIKNCKNPKNSKDHGEELKEPIEYAPNNKSIESLKSDVHCGKDVPNSAGKSHAFQHGVCRKSNLAMPNPKQVIELDFE